MREYRLYQQNKPRHDAHEDPLMKVNDTETYYHERFFSPELESQVHSIMHEIEEEREQGKVLPFVEGEVIGAYQKRKDVMLAKSTLPAKGSREWWQDQRERTLRLRRRNNRNLTTLHQQVNADLETLALAKRTRLEENQDGSL